ncbi:MAG: Uma2 family endonuclease [Gemmataceae bacterium]
MGAILLPERPEAQESDGGGLLRVPRAAHNLAGFRRWALAAGFPEKLPVAFIRGEVFIDMSKEEIRTHALTKTGLAGGLFLLNEEIDFGHLFINGVLVTNEEADLSTNPDLLAISYRSLKTGRVRYLENRGRIVEIQGSPDMVAEIVSESSVFKDTELLRAAYHTAEIPEYWLIDARGQEIVFQILRWRKSGYVATEATDGWLRSRVWKRLMRLTRRRDRAGEWKYRLEARAED